MANSQDLKSRCAGAAALASAFASAAMFPWAAAAQGPASRPVVQPVPPSSLNDLNAALKDLSHDPANVPALLRAGWASLGLDDTQAALGFFRRAASVQPQNGEVKAGLASASLRQGDPVGAVRLFADAEASGAPMARYAADRGLALDLVGNNAAAQTYYRQALAQNPDPETSRRLALSQAIAGDENASDATLLPLLQHRDLAAYRTRAFALAILGKGEQAVSIAQTMLPAQISSRLAPYLRYMPRLTRAQQAAAANLGQFPPASEIGHDDPQIAAFSGPPPAQVAAATPDSRLMPTGAPLGSSKAQKAAAPAPAPKPTKARVKGGKQGTVNVTYTPLAQAAPPPAAAPTPAPLASPPPPPPSTELKPVLVASLEPPPSSAPPSPPIQQAPVEQAPRPSLSITAATAPPPAKKGVSLAEAFADFATPAAATRPTAGAVDILKIKPTREPSKAEQAKAQQAKAEAAKAEAAKAEAAKAKAKAKANPSRVWVQIGTGRNVKALGFTWRRLQKDGGALLARHDGYSARWGATRRLLAGPYKSEDAADDAVKALKKKGFDAFEFTSDEGEEVTPLD